MKPIFVRNGYVAMLAGFLFSTIICLSFSNSALATDVSQSVNTNQSGKLKNPSTEATAPYKYSADDLQLMIRIIDLSRLIAVNGPTMEKAIKVKGMTPDDWTLGVLGVIDRNGRRSGGTNAINISVLNSTAEASRWTDATWRPALKQQYGLLGLNPGEGQLPSCATTKETIQTARKTLQQMIGDPSVNPFDELRSGTGDPRISKGFVEKVVEAVGKFIGESQDKYASERGGRYADEGAGGSATAGGVRGQPVPEGGSGGSVAPNTKSIWWQLINMGSRWGRINPAMGQPKPVDPGIEPSGPHTPDQIISDPKKDGVGNPNIINPNPEKPATGSSHGGIPKKIDTKGKTPTPDPIEPTSGPSVPVPGGKGGILPK